MEKFTLFWIPFSGTSSSGLQKNNKVYLILVFFLREKLINIVAATEKFSSQDEQPKNSLSKKTYFEFLYIDFFLITTMAFLFGKTASCDHLSSTPPPTRLLSLGSIVSILGQIAIAFAVQVRSFFIDIAKLQSFKETSSVLFLRFITQKLRNLAIIRETPGYNYLYEASDSMGLAFAINDCKHTLRWN